MAGKSVNEKRENDGRNAGNLRSGASNSSGVVVKLETEEEELSCSKCPEIFYSRSDLNKHQLSHKSNCKASRYQCRTCGQICTQLREMKAHMEEHQDSKQKQAEVQLESDLIDKNQANLTCDICLVAFGDQLAFSNHVSEAHPDRHEFPCGICAERFVSVSDLSDHHLSAHNEDLPVCHTCQLRFTSADSYESHVRRKHKSGKQPLVNKLDLPKKSLTDRKVEICPSCQEVFTIAGQYAAHLPCPIALAYPDELRCPFCPRKLPTLAKLDSHIEEFHTAPPTSHKCPTCRMEFPTRLQLNCHRKAHRDSQKQAEQTSFGCNRCSSEFDSSDQLLEHLRSVCSS